MNLAKKTVITNTAKQALGVSAQNVEDVICELHKNDNDKFAIGDIKLTTRTINDPNWALCNGGLAPDAILDDAVINGDFSTVTFTAQNSNIQHIYDDGDTVLVFYKDTLTAATTSGSRFISVDVFTKTSVGTLELSATKSIYTGTTSRSVTQIGCVVKCGGYYHLAYGVQNNSSSSNVSKQTLYISYVSETNPTGTWTSVEIMNTSSSPSTCLPFAFYTNGTKLRLDITTATATYSGSVAVTSYAFNPRGTSISSSSMGEIKGGYYTLWTRDQAEQVMNANGVYVIARGLSASVPIYKSSFTSNWGTLSAPQIGSPGDFPWNSVFYFNNLYWALIGTASSPSQNVPTIIAANTFAKLYGSSGNLTYNFALSNAAGSQSNTPVQVTESYAVMYYRTAANKLGILVIDTSNQTHYYEVTELSSPGYYSGAYGNTPMYTVGASSSAETTAVSGGVPNIQVTGTSAYIKIADN